ncbi:hypothetical protein CHISP_0796 [Chitinispirillum alkaliphilum]|nr:hypothetical protein CHISP_0796 [Chitinispirillum alkaliphilum]
MPIKILTSIFASFVILHSQQLIIEDYLNEANAADYLLIAPELFVNQTLRLAHHRNSFQGDGVGDAKVVRLETIDSIFRTHDTVQRYKALWKGLKYANENWSEPLKYIVFIGNDSLGWDSTGRLVNFGLMPSIPNGYQYYRRHGGRDTVIRYSDDYYLSVNRSSLYPVNVPRNPQDLRIGRIPCQTVSELSTYIDKVIAYDLGRRFEVSNNALLIADDARKANVADPLGFSHFTTAQTISTQTALSWYNITRLYLSMYTMDENFRHVEANQEFHSVLNNQKWIIFFGHGSPGVLTDEHLITSSDLLLVDRNYPPFIFLSFSCLNGVYHIPKDSSMLKQALFTENGGAVAYVASTTLEYALPNENFANAMFRVYSSDSGVTLGQMVNGAKRSIMSRVEHYHLFGDPALRVRSVPLEPQITFTGNGNLRVSLPHIFSTAEYYLTISRFDTLKLLEDTTQSFTDEQILFTQRKGGNGEVEFALPDNLSGDLRFNLYAGNDIYEARKDTVIYFDVLQNNNAVLTRNKTPEILVSGSNLIFRNIEKEGMDLKLYDLRGRLIEKVSYRNLPQNFIFNLASLNAASGQYIIVVNDGRCNLLSRVVRIF